MQGGQSGIIGQTYVTRNTSVCHKCRNLNQIQNLCLLSTHQTKMKWGGSLIEYYVSFPPRFFPQTVAPLKSWKMNSHCTEIELFVRGEESCSRGEGGQDAWGGKRVGEPTLEQNRFLATRPGPNPAFGKNRLELFEILHHDRLTINPLPETCSGKVGGYRSDGFLGFGRHQQLECRRQWSC